MSRAGRNEHSCRDALVERNLRQRVFLLSLFAVLLLGADFFPFFQLAEQENPGTMLLGQAEEQGAWQLRLTAQESSGLEAGVFRLAGGHAGGAALTDDCSAPPAIAPFFNLTMDINRAELKDLTLLPGIGPVLGERIITEREKSGPYASPQALLQVSGVGPQTLAALAPHICTQ